MTYITLNNTIPCLDPADLAEHTERENLPVDYARRANSYRCPLGCDAGEAWILLNNSLFRNLNLNTFHTLRFINPDTTAITIARLYVAYAYSMASMPNVTDQQPMLVRLVDKRWILNKLSSTGSAPGTDGEFQYNVLYPYASEDDTANDIYFPESLNGGSRWQWNEIVNDLWAKLPSGVAGSAPSLPYSPGTQAQDLRFFGVSAWRAIEQVLAKIHCAVRYDPINDSFSIIRLGTTQAGLSSALSQLSSARNFDFHAAEGKATSLPATVRVFFRRSYFTWGVRNDTVREGNLAMKPYYAVDVATGASGAIAGTVMPLWDELYAQYDAAGALTNSSALNARANEVASDLVGQLNVSDEPGRVHYNFYRGNILPGSQVKAVVWRDYGDGPITEIMRARGMHRFGPEGEMAGAGMEAERPSPGSAEALLPPDCGRRTLFIHDPMIIRADSNIDRVADIVAEFETPVTGDAYLWKFNDDAWEDTEQQKTFYNVFGVKVNADEFQFVHMIDGVPVIDAPRNYCYHVTATNAIVAGATGTVTLPDGRDVVAENWSDDTDIAVDDKIFVWEDLVDANFYALKPGSGQDDGAIVTIVSSSADENCLWDGRIVVPQDGSSYCSSQFENGDECWVAVLNEVGGSTTVAKLPPNRQYLARRVGETNGRPVYAIRFEETWALVLEGYVYEQFSFQDETFRMKIHRAMQGPWPTDVNGAPLDDVIVRNFDRVGVDPHGRGPYLFEGEYGAAVRAEFDPEFSTGPAVNFYRADWVECPETSPVEAPGLASKGPGFIGDGMYAQGGFSPAMIPTYYYGD